MKKRHYRPSVEGMEAREVPTAPGTLNAAVNLPRRMPLAIKGTVYGTFSDNGPGNIVIDTARPITNLFRSNTMQTVHGVLTRDVATNQVSGWLVVQVSGRQVPLTVTGSAKNVTVLGKVVNLKFTGTGEFANTVRPGNIRLMLNTPVRGRETMVFA